LIKQQWSVTLLALVACGGGGSTGSVAPAKTPAGTVESFMQAVADSDLTRMAQLWGTAAGPAAKTRTPPDYERRIAVMQSYLRNESHRVLPVVSSGSEARQDVQVELRRELCTWVVPFTTIKDNDGHWIVNQVDISQAGNPARPCVPGGAQDSAAAQDSVPE
jgi:hypothetical protein